MKLFYYQSPSGLKNLGDDLNLWLWEKLIPGILDEDEDAIFVGIGTLLNNRLPKACQTVVMGSGVGYGSALPNIDSSWKIYCLRGPLSAKALNLPEKLSIIDPAVLVRNYYHINNKKRYKFGYMPHAVSSKHAGNSWEIICQDLGILYIDARWPIEKVLSAITEVEILIAEAMHGAIVADALRVPWIPVQSRITLPFKWLDWSLSIGVDYKPGRIVSLYDYKPRRVAGKIRKFVKAKIVLRQLSFIMNNKRAVLSAESTIEQKISQLHECIFQFKKDIAAGRFVRKTLNAICT